MVALYEEIHPKGFEILAVNLREDASTIAGFAEDFDMRFPVLLDRVGQVAGDYYVRAIPTSVFIDDQGIIRYIHIGVLTEEKLQQYIDSMM
jgi:hypothetical protein